MTTKKYLQKLDSIATSVYVFEKYHYLPKHATKASKMVSSIIGYGHNEKMENTKFQIEAWNDPASIVLDNFFGYYI